jgi:hypothetical protein
MVKIYHEIGQKLKKSEKLLIIARMEWMYLDHNDDIKRNISNLIIINAIIVIVIIFINGSIYNSISISILINSIAWFICNYLHYWRPPYRVLNTKENVT